MQYKKIYEFLVWDNCNNNCKFCWQREAPRIFSHNKREFILNEVLAFIDSDVFEFGSHILICGGEIFDKPIDFEILDKFFCRILGYMIEGKVDLLYINTNLIYKDLTGVNTLLNRIKLLGLFDRLKFTTSYDIAGRFKNESDRELMLSNLKILTGVYKQLKTVTNIILTKQACESVLSGEFRPDEFMNKYRCWINFIPYIVLDRELMPTRNQVFKTLIKIDDVCPGYLEKYVPNMSITQEKCLYMYKNNKFQFCSSAIGDCGHSVNFKRYSDSDTCFCCDILELFNG